MKRGLERKYRFLIDYLGGFQRLGVACSGGVDSTFLAHACCQALGPDRVLVLFADSPLLPAALREGVEQRLIGDLGRLVEIVKIPIDPFSHEEFVANPAGRCYLCKIRIYREFLDYLEGRGVAVLADGTNVDDLGQDRPGLRALAELRVITPLVEAGFHKREIRAAAAELGLGSADLPSSSCLATRLETGTEISAHGLRHIDRLEAYLLERGYRGCRVRPRAGAVIIEVMSRDVARLSRPRERGAVLLFFAERGYRTVLLDLRGRGL